APDASDVPGSDSAPRPPDAARTRDTHTQPQEWSNGPGPGLVPVPGSDAGNVDARAAEDDAEDATTSESAAQMPHRATAAVHPPPLPAPWCVGYACA
ncbi:hypothetical protein EW145_g8646, partial [Phellinidium pouzarii]